VEATKNSDHEKWRNLRCQSPVLGGRNFPLNACTFLPDSKPLHFRRMCYEILAHLPHLPVISCVWPSIPEIKSLLDRFSVLALSDIRGNMKGLVKSLHWMVIRSVTTLGGDNWMSVWGPMKFTLKAKTLSKSGTRKLMFAVHASLMKSRNLVLCSSGLLRSE
jgi:hypothetical protein